LSSYLEAEKGKKGLFRAILVWIKNGSEQGDSELLDYDTHAACMLSQTLSSGEL
jgi:hypothetical protein